VLNIGRARASKDQIEVSIKSGRLRICPRKSVNC
jgi:hypothetical protein